MPETMKIDAYVVDVLMRDLVAHSRSAVAFLVYLQLYRQTHGAGKDRISMSLQSLAEVIGVSKRAVQSAIAHLLERRLIRRHKKAVTAVPVYAVLTPWIR